MSTLFVFVDDYSRLIRWVEGASDISSFELIYDLINDFRMIMDTSIPLIK